MVGEEAVSTALLDLSPRQGGCEDDDIAWLPVLAAALPDDARLLVRVLDPGTGSLRKDVHLCRRRRSESWAASLWTRVWGSWGRRWAPSPSSWPRFPQSHTPSPPSNAACVEPRSPPLVRRVPLLLPLRRPPQHGPVQGLCPLRVLRRHFLSPRRASFWASQSQSLGFNSRRHPWPSS